MQPRSAERQRVLSWEPCHPRTPLEHEPQRGSVTGTSLRHRFAHDGTALRSETGKGRRHLIPKGASLRLGTLGLHAGTALRFSMSRIALIDTTGHSKPNGLAPCSPGVPSASERSPGTPHPLHDRHCPTNPNGLPSPERPRHLASPQKASRPIFASFSAPKLEISPKTPKTVAPGAPSATPGDRRLQPSGPERMVQVAQPARRTETAELGKVCAVVKRSLPLARPENPSTITSRVANPSTGRTGCGSPARPGL